MTIEPQNQLKELGFTENDSKVYIYLLERGVPAAGSKIAAKLELHRQYVHSSLQKLKKMDLVEEIPSGARIQYKALPPQYLTHLAKKQLEIAERAARELEKISTLGDEQDFEVYKGTRQVVAFEENLVHNLKEDETQYIIGGGAEAFITFFGDQYDEITSVAREKRLKTKYIACNEEVPWLNRAQAILGKDFEYVILENFPKTSVQTVIRLNTVTFYSFGNPPLVYIVKSKTVAEDYLKFFNMLWGISLK